MDDFYHNEMDKIAAENKVKKIASIKKQLPEIIEKMSNEEIEYLFKVAESITDYMRFEATMRSLFGSKKY